MMPKVLNLVSILLEIAVRSTGDIASGEVVDTMEMPDREIDLLLPGHQLPGESDGGDFPVVELEKPKRMTVEELLTVHLMSCMEASSGSQPVGIQVMRKPLTNEPTRMTLNMSEIFRAMTLWTITHQEKPIGMLYISGNRKVRGHADMLPVEDLDDTIGVAVIPGYKMMNQQHSSSLPNFIKFLNKAIANVWSPRLHYDNHLTLWDNIFRIFIRLCSGTSVEIPYSHKSTCSLLDKCPVP